MGVNKGEDVSCLVEYRTSIVVILSPSLELRYIVLLFARCSAV